MWKIVQAFIRGYYLGELFDEIEGKDTLMLNKDPGQVDGPYTDEEYNYVKDGQNINIVNNAMMARLHYKSWLWYSKGYKNDTNLDRNFTSKWHDTVINGVD